MKFVCDRCTTKYSIADEKVRGRILKIRCKSCSNIITVKESVPSPISVTSGESDRTVITSGPHIARAAAAAVHAGVARGRGAPPSPPGAAPGDDIQWFMAIAGVQKGPFPRKVLIDRLAALAANSDVHVWNDTLDGWRPPAEVPQIARELQARHRPDPTPPAPPNPRLRPVPPPPSQSALPAPAHGGAMAASAHGMPALSGGGHSVHGAVSHGGHASNGHANHSGLSLGLASVAPVAHPAPHPAAVGPAVLLDTPAPIRELVQAHHAHNGAESHGAGLAVASAPSVLANGESDALSTLNLGGGWRQPGAPLAPADGRFSSASIAAATGGRPGQRTLKLALGAIALVGICLALFFVAFRKPAPPPPPVATAPVAAPPAPIATAPEAPKELKPAPPSTGPTETVGETDVAGLRAETVARVAGSKKATRPAPVRNPSLRPPAGPTAPGPLTALTPEQRAEANRFGDTSSKAIQLRNPAAAVSKVTPAQGDITRVVNNNKGGIKVCYQRALLRDTSLTHGKIDVDVSIGISGRVKKVSIDGPAAFRSLDPCIKDVLSRWVFPASSEEYGTAFSYVFQGNE
jgi:predicted Zn finger-like uncharacterized protein